MTEEPSGAEWLTVSAASKVLGISDRQTRRWAGRLADVDRKPDGRGGRLVRLSALLSLRESDASPDAGHDRGPEVGRKPEASRTDADMGRTSDRDELIEQLQARLQERGEEIEYLRGALQREQAIAMTATSDAAELRRKLEALTDGLIEASSAGNPMHGTEAGKPHAVPSGGSVAAGEAPAGEDRFPPILRVPRQDREEGARESHTDSRKTTENAGFWGRVRALFGGGDR